MILGVSASPPPPVFGARMSVLVSLFECVCVCVSHSVSVNFYVSMSILLCECVGQLWLSQKEF